jgi:hypothetical protein
MHMADPRQYQRAAAWIDLLRLLILGVAAGFTMVGAILLVNSILGH